MVNALKYPGIGGKGVHAIIVPAEAVKSLPANTFKSYLVVDESTQLVVFDNHGQGYNSTNEALAAVLEHLNPRRPDESADSYHSFWLASTGVFMYDEIPASNLG